MKGASCRNIEKITKTTHGKPKWQMLPILNRPLIVTPNIGLHESLQTFCAEIKQFLAIAVFQLFRKSIFRLSDFELAGALQGHQADAQVGAA